MTRLITKLQTPFAPNNVPKELLVFQNNLLTHRINNFTIELGRLSSWEANFLCKIIWQQIKEFSISLFVKQWLIYEFCIIVRFAARGNSEVEVQC